MNITIHGTVDVPRSVIEAADKIKHLNYKTTTPAKFQKNTLTEDIAGSLLDDVSRAIGITKDRLDYVYFSACKGAEPHTDLLDPAKFQERTFIIPVILPKGANIIFVEGETQEVKIGEIYEFSHEKVHGMTVEDEESGCVVIMIAIKK